MSDYRKNLPAEKVHTLLRSALTELQRAEMNAVLWFAEIRNRELYRQLGYASIHQYATEALGFSQSRTYQFLRLADSLQDLPRLKAAVAAGEIGWTKAREVAKVATRKSERSWIAAAKRSSRRDLEIQVAEARAARKAEVKTKVQAARLGDRMQPALDLPSIDRTAEAAAAAVATTPAATTTTAEVAATAAAAAAAATTTAEEAATAAAAKAEAATTTEVMPTMADRVAGPRSGARRALDAKEELMALTLKFTPEQFILYETLLEKIHRSAGARSERVQRGASREELVLTALAELLEVLVQDAAVHQAGPNDGSGKTGKANSKGHAGRNCTRVQNSTHYQVVSYRCEECGKSSVPTSRGLKKLSKPAAEAIACDCRIQGPDGSSRTAIPPRVRRTVMSRDRHCCQAPGCGRTRFLEIHHIVPRHKGGGNDPENLVTLCSACHRLLHERGDQATGRLRLRGGRGMLALK